jgi:hypothetical protein
VTFVTFELRPKEVKKETEQILGQKRSS